MTGGASIQEQLRQTCAAAPPRLPLRRRRLLLPRGDAHLRRARRPRARDRTGQGTVPSVWIDGKHVGGCDSTVALEHSGRLVPMLQEAGAY